MTYSHRRGPQRSSRPSAATSASSRSARSSAPGLFPDRLRDGPQRPHRQARDDPRLEPRRTRARANPAPSPSRSISTTTSGSGPTAEMPFTEDRVHPQVGLRPAGLAPDRALLPRHDHRLGLAHERHRPVGQRHATTPGRSRSQAKGRVPRPRPVRRPHEVYSPKASTPTASA